MQSINIEELKKRLTDVQFNVTQKKDTERPWTGEYCSTKDKGTYHCIVCDEELFDSEGKFESGCGWPSFSRGKKKENIAEEKDVTHGMVRTEVTCAKCGSHLGHVFDDGPAPTGLRYCINSASLLFKKA